MKKELALAAILALIATNVTGSTQIDDVDHSEHSVNMDLYVTGCQCKAWKPRFGKKKNMEDWVDWS